MLPIQRRHLGAAPPKALPIVIAAIVLMSCLVVPFVLAALGITAWFIHPRSASPPTFAGPGRPAAPSVNPLDQQLRAQGAPAARREGIGVAVLIDTSGSMQEPVSDADGQKRPKIEIARRAVLEIVRQVDKFGKAKPDKPLLVGLYEFSGRDRQPNCRIVLPLAPADLPKMEQAVQRLKPNGNTPIGDAMIQAKRDLAATGLTRQHILVVTDGDNNQGYAPGDVTQANQRLPEDQRASIYLVAFDVAAAKFDAVKNAGGLVLSAASEPELRQTLDYVLTGKILVEQPVAPTNP